VPQILIQVIKKVTGDRPKVVGTRDLTPMT
jgi:hypothetical protein